MGMDLGRLGSRFHRPRLWGVAEAKRALLGWQKPMSELNRKNKREHCTLGKSLPEKETKPGGKNDPMGGPDIFDSCSLQLTPLGHMGRSG